MAAEEDKKFDAVLGGFLVNDLRIRARNLTCPEPDTLAAYHERSLLPEEMNSWKEHIVGCGRCQAILAELEATESISVQVPEKEEVLMAAATARAADEPSSVRKEAPSALPKKSRVTPISRGVRWHWLAPAGAIAAALLVWVAWHENQQLQTKAPTEVKTAKLEPPGVPAPSVTRDDRQAASAQEVSPMPRDKGVVSGLVAKPASEAKGLKQFEKSDSRGRIARSVSPADKETSARADAALDSLAAANRAQKQLAQDAKAGVPGAMSQTVEVQTPTANAQTQNQQAQQTLQAQQSALSEQEISGPNPSRARDSVKKRKSESPATGYHAAPAAPQPAPRPVMAYNDGAALRMAAAVSPSVISAPDKKTLWRVSHIGMIEFSSDGGASWSRQTSNVSVDLTSGSAPSERVCWIVGRAGTILLTTDTGSHWSTIHSPIDEDLGGVNATDALHATIWNLGSTKIFETSDGGTTWKTATSQ